MQLMKTLLVILCAKIMCTGCINSEQKENIAPDGQAKIYAYNIVENRMERFWL